MGIFNRKKETEQTTAGPQRGQTLVEYGLILLLVAIVVVTMIKVFGNTTKNTYNSIACSVRSAAQ